MADPTRVPENALSLDVRDRASTAEELLRSLEDLSQNEADRLWTVEAQGRFEGYYTGRATPIPAKVVAKKAERLFR